MDDDADTMGPEARYLAFLGEGRFMLQRARGSGRFVFHPRIAEPGTGDTDLEWVEASGLGRVYSATTVFPRPPAEPFVIALIDLDEGPRVLSRVVGGDSAAVSIGLRVAAFVEDCADGPRVMFRPEAENP